MFIVKWMTLFWLHVLGTIMMSGCGILTNGKGTRREYCEFSLDELQVCDEHTHSHTHTHISLCHLPRKCVCFYNLRRLLSSTFRREITLGWCAKPAERSTFTSMASTKVRRIKTLHEGERGPVGGCSHVMVINKWLRNTRKMGTSETWTDLFVFFSFLLFLYFCYPVIPWCFTQ